MPVSILKHGQQLIATAQGSLTDDDLKKLREDLTNKVGQFRTHGVVADVSTVDVLDSYAARTLREVAQTIRLRGAELVLAGIQPDVAMTMVQLGITMHGIRTVLDLDEAMSVLQALEAERNRRLGN
jgi:rsbT antagonist protein RsbS